MIRWAGWPEAKSGPGARAFVTLPRWRIGSITSRIGADRQLGDKHRASAAVEEAAQHIAERFGRDDPRAVAQRLENGHDLEREAFVLCVVAENPVAQIGPDGRQRQCLALEGVMRGHNRLELGSRPAAALGAGARQIIGDGFEQVTERGQSIVSVEQSSQTLARGAPGQTFRVDDGHAWTSLGHELTDAVGCAR